MPTSLFILDSASRLYWVYLIGSTLFGFVLITWQKQNAIRAFAPLFSASLWFTRSTWVDLQWLLLNTLLKLTLLSPLLAAQYTIALEVNRWLYETLGEGNFFGWGYLSVMISFTVLIFVVDDFSRFYIHRLYHRIPWLWRFHAIHHSALALTPLTFYRIHSFEFIINSLRSVLVAGSISGIFLYLFEANIGLLDILGINVFVFTFNVLGSNLRHSPVWLGYGWFENVFISPAQHQIHHSSEREHLNKNMGSSLAIWDCWFGSLLLSQEQVVKHFGVLGHSNKQRFASQLKGIA